MTIDPAPTLFTQKAAPASGQSSAQALSIGGLFSLGAGGDITFLDMILGNGMTQDGSAIPGKPEKKKDDGNDPLAILLHQAVGQTQAPLPVALEIPEDATLAAEAFLAGSIDIGTEDSAPHGAGIPDDMDPATMKALQEALSALLAHLLAGLPEDAKARIKTPGMPEATQNGLTHAVDENASAALIASGLSPQDITAFMTELAERLKQGEAFIVGLVKLLPPKTATDGSDGKRPGAIFLPRGFVVLPQASAAAKHDGQVNPLIESNMPETGDISDNGFDGILKILEQAQSTDKTVMAADTPKSAAPSPGLSTTPHQPGHKLPELGMLFDGTASDSVYPEGLDWLSSLRGAPGHAAGLTLNGPALMTSLVGNAPQAASPHPTVQIVASAMTKAAADGQKNITLRLEPPELGRVEVRMEFDKDRTVKVHLAVEKQETWLMLQRDAHALHRALADAGLSADGNALSFSLGGQDGGLFDHGQSGHGGGNDSGGGSTGGGEANDGLIEATMTWIADPVSGHTHYSILA